MIGLINANTLQIPLADKSVHMTCTSPPYWNLRQYGDYRMVILVGTLDDFHPPKSAKRKRRWWYSLRERAILRGEIISPNGNSWIGQFGLESLHDCCGWMDNREPYIEYDYDGEPYIAWRFLPGGRLCNKCYICHMRQVGAEVWRVLRDNGTFWLNLGDSYSGSGAGESGGHGPNSLLKDKKGGAFGDNQKKVGSVPGLKAKNLVGIPWRVALALQADGWYLRSDIVWAKKNPMPASVTDRPTTSHEYVFLLTKRPKYFYDQDAIREPLQESTINRFNYVNDGGNQKLSYGDDRVARINPLIDQPGRKERIVEAGRNKWTVWHIATQSYGGSHFATFPEDLVEPMIKAGTSERGCCPECGVQWDREVEKEFIPQQDVSLQRGLKGANGQKPMDVSNSWDGWPRGSTIASTTGWRPTCEHNHNPRPCIVLDPFAGSGTTGVVSRRLGRHFIGLDLSFGYLRNQAKTRLEIDRLEAWGGGIQDETDYDNIPLMNLLRSIGGTQ